VSGSGAVLATVSSDAHGWNLVYLELVLRECGFDVVNLGPCTAVREVVDAVVDTAPALVVLSTVNGHGAFEAPAYARALRADVRTRSVPVVVGGKLTTDDRLDEHQRERLHASGFDRVFVEADAVARFRAFVGSLVVADVAADIAG
jgi:methylaspartate mutase sigma subunit